MKNFLKLVHFTMIGIDFHKYKKRSFQNRATSHILKNIAINTALSSFITL